MFDAAFFVSLCLCGSFPSLLEDKPQRQLDDARLRVADTAAGNAGAGNLTERAAGERGIWISKQWMVQRVEHLGAELQPCSLVNVRPFSDAEIKIRSRRSTECVPANVPICPLRRIVHRIESLSGRGSQATGRKRVGIEEVVAAPSVE